MGDHICTCALCECREPRLGVTEATSNHKLSHAFIHFHLNRIYTEPTEKKKRKKKTRLHKACMIYLDLQIKVKPD